MICWHFQPRILRALHFMKKDLVILGEDLEKLLDKLPYTPTSRRSLFLPFHPTSTVLFRCCATSTAVFLIHFPVKIYISHLLFFLTSSTFHNPESSSWLQIPTAPPCSSHFSIVQKLSLPTNSHFLIACLPTVGLTR